MADVLTGLTEVDATIETIVSTQITEVLTATAVVPGSIMDLSSMVGPGMDTVAIPKYSSFTVNTKAENTAVDAQANAFSTDDLVLNRHKVIQWLVEDIAEVQSKIAVDQAYVEQAAKDLAVEMDQALIDGLESGSSAAAPDHRLDYAGASLAKADVLTGRQKLNAAKVPLADRFLLVNEVSEAALMGISEFTRVDEAGGSEALRNGQIGKLFGFTVLMSPLAETLKTLAYHKSAMAFARQIQPRVQEFYDLPNLAMRKSIDHLYGFKIIQGGNRVVMLGTAA